VASGERLSGTGGAVELAPDASTCTGCDFVCPADILLNIYPGEQASNLENVSVTSPGVEFDCWPTGAVACQWVCHSSVAVSNGEHVITISALGAAPKTLDIMVLKPTSCCCGCCSFAYTNSIVLDQNQSSASACCADLMADNGNCGACGQPCTQGQDCSLGRCALSRP
jgi:hypothetical protein